MALLLADEHFPLPVVEGLRQLGHDVVTVRDLGLDNQGFPDSGVLARATVEGRAVLTENRWDYVRLHRQGQQHAGIVSPSKDSDHAAATTRIHAAVTAAGDLTGQLIRVNLPPREQP